MVARLEAIPNQIADQVVVYLKRIDAGVDAVKWLTRPKVVQRVIGPSVFGNERPALYLELRELRDTPQQGGFHEAQLDLAVYCVNDDLGVAGEAPDSALVRLASDVVRALTDNEGLAGLVVMLDGITWKLDVDERSGITVAVVTTTALYKWQHGAP